MPVPFITDNYREYLNPPINWYPAADQDKGVIMFASEGLDALVTPCEGQVRAFRDMGDYLYVIVGSHVYQITTAWAATLLGNLSNDYGPAWIEHNGTQVAFCDGAQLYVYTPGTATYSLVTDADFPGAQCLSYQDGYGAFINPNTNQFYITGSYDFTTIDALDYASAEGWPDLITGIKMHYRELWLFGPETIEFWDNKGGVFPFERIGGPGMVHQGLGAVGSIQQHDNGIMMMNKHREIVKFTGYQPTVVSTPRMTREIEGYASVTDAISFKYAIRGHNTYGITFPSGNATWLYDAKVKTWHRRESWQTGTDVQGKWRGNACYYWNNTQLVGDFENGKIYRMSPDYLDDDGSRIVRVLDSQEIRNGGLPIYFPGLQILFNHGEAAAGLDPQAMLSYTDDGGHTWSEERWRSAGLIGEYSKRARWLRLGRAKEHRAFRLKVSDACNWDILSVDMIK